jgi:hypothetical protein
MHENAQRILKKIATSRGGINLDDLARAFQAEAKRMLASKGGSRSAQAVGKQANSLVRNHLRPLVRAGFVKRAGRGAYTVTAKGRKALGGPAAGKAKTVKKAKAVKKAKTAKKAKAARKTKAAKKNLRVELSAIRAQLKRLSGRVEKLAKKL